MKIILTDRDMRNIMTILRHAMEPNTTIYDIADQHKWLTIEREDNATIVTIDSDFVSDCIAVIRNILLLLGGLSVMFEEIEQLANNLDKKWSKSPTAEEKENQAL